MGGTDTILQVTDLSKTFKLSAKQQRLENTSEKLRRAVDRLSFTVRKSEIYGLLGPNGAGKTTTLRMLATLIRPDSGDALVDGYSVVHEPQQVRSRIGFLTSELKLEEFFTPSYLFDFFARLHNVDPALAAAHKQRLFERFGIGEFSEVKVASLSTGMKQKASLAISIVHDPAIIIFDEPTNGLDVLTARVVTDYLAELRDAGKTIVLSTHIFSLAERLCDSVGIIVGGQMSVSGTLDEVRAGKDLEDRFFDLYQQQAGEAA
ncbi:MAG: ATP-binding cassette domain-containing protein [Coriobacteriales bacterium]|jgi:sodium transport system ATP-binding protein|nr:ATP-binding cassette domain-containing protein [Coriobacteriales bacterium]